MPQRRRSAAQRAATKKLVALNRRRRRKNPSRRRRAYKATRTLTPARRRRRNPAKRRRRSYPRPSAQTASRAGRTLRRYRRNPVRRNMLDTMVFPALTATTGALALDIAWANLPLPANIKAGPFKHVAKGLGAVGMAWLAGMVVRPKTAEALGVGALTVVLHQAAREFIGQAMPQLNMGYYNAGMPAGGYDNNNMGLYVQSQPSAPPADMGLYVGEYNSDNYNYS